MGWTIYLVYGPDWSGWFEFQAFTPIYLLRVRVLGLALCVFKADLEEVGAEWFYWHTGEDPRSKYEGQPLLRTIEEARERASEVLK